MLALTNLRCEYAENPLGIDSPHPRLAWMPTARGGRDHFPSAYQVWAATTPEGLAHGAPDLWDSGKVRSEAVQVEYGGRPLRSGERCYWQARAWDENDQPGPFSGPAWFEMGLLSAEDWQAEWIGCPPLWPARPLYFRRDFTLEKPVRRARVYMAGLGWSELYVNGQRANDRVMDPPQSDYSRRVYYTTDAVEGLLRPGKNAIGVICGPGWYGTVRVLLQLNIEYSDGSTEKIYSQTNWAVPWQINGGPILESGVYSGETYDARQEIAGWGDPDAPNEGINSYAADGPGGRLAAAPLEPIRVVQTLRARSISQPMPGVYVFDLGQNIAGWARLRVHGPAGTRISLRFAENRYPDGTVNQENLRNAHSEDVYILHGRGEEIWEPRFTYHGFRYIQVEGWPGIPNEEMVEGRVVRSSVAAAGTFECSNDLINRIHRMIAWTESGNLHSIPTDCPQRDERMGWLNDMAARTEEALYNYDLARLLAKWMGDIADEQDPRTGAITDTAPFHWGRRPADPVSVCYILIPWLLYVHYGDRVTMSERYAGMKAWVDFLSSCAREHIVEYSYYGDWSPPVNMGLPGSLGNSAVSKDTPGNLVSSACYAYSARTLGQIAGALGKEADAAAYLGLAEQIVGRFNTCFWDEASGGYGSNNQSCNAIALYMGMVPAERRARVEANLVQNVVERWGGHLTTGNICTKYLLEALTAAGRADAAYQVATQETYPGWGYMLANGATTLWERWEMAAGGGMNSHNHPMMGSVGAWFYRALAGIRADPAGPGFRRLELCPQPLAGLTSARAALETVRGKIVSGWQIEDGELRVDFEIPVGCQARVRLPVPTGASLREGGGVVWQGEWPALGAAVHREGHHLVFTLGSGAYNFVTQSMV